MMKIISKHLTTIDSTNNWAKQHVTSIPSGSMLIVTAEEQTAGRGRFNRRWESPAGENIYATFAFQVGQQRKDLGNIPQVLALSGAKVLTQLGFTPKIKWPNDLLINNKKVGGILAETTASDNQLYFVVGIGVNLNMPLERLLKIDRPATSLKVESGQSFVVPEVMQRLQTQFLQDLDLFFLKGFTPFLEMYRFFMIADPIHPVRFHDNQKVWRGIIQQVNNDGSLSLKLENGEIKTFIAGEILQDG